MSQEYSSFLDKETTMPIDAWDFQAQGMGFNSAFDARYLMFKIDERISERSVRVNAALMQSVNNTLTIAQFEEEDLVHTNEVKNA